MLTEEEIITNITLGKYLFHSIQFHLFVCVDQLGIYQVKRARSYAEERSSTTDLTKTLDYPIYRCQRFPDVIKAPTRSAHISRKTYNPIIRFNSETVLDWWCDCPSGSRYVGCCSHIASVIWFLSFERWQLQSHRKGSSGFVDLFMDAAVLPEVIESSSEDDDDDDNNDDESDG